MGVVERQHEQTPELVAQVVDVLGDQHVAAGDQQRRLGRAHELRRLDQHGDRDGVRAEAAVDVLDRLEQAPLVSDALELLAVEEGALGGRRQLRAGGRDEGDVVGRVGASAAGGHHEHAQQAPLRLEGRGDHRLEPLPARLGQRVGTGMDVVYDERLSLPGDEAGHVVAGRDGGDGCRVLV